MAYATSGANQNIDGAEIEDEVLSSVDFCGEREDDEIRIVLVGRTGAGKSSTGNTLLKQKIFFSQASGSSVTERCQIGKCKYINRKIVLVDTPGLFDTKLPQGQVTKEIIRCIHMSTPGPHVFLLVLRLDRFTNEEIQTFNSLFDIFGEEMSNFAVITFTRLDDLENDNITVEDFLKTSNKELKDFVKRCQNRYIAFNNRATKEQKDKKVAELMEVITTMINRNKGKHYTNEMYKVAEANLQRKIAEVKRLKELEKAKEIEKIQSQYKGQMDEIENKNKTLEKDLSLQQNEAAHVKAKMEETEKALSKIRTEMKALNEEHDRELIRIQTEEKGRRERQLQELQARESEFRRLESGMREQKKETDRLRHEMERQKQSEIKSLENMFENQMKSTVRQVIEDNNEQIRLMQKQLVQKDLEYERRMDEKDRKHQRLLKSHNRANKEVLDDLTDKFQEMQEQNERKMKKMQEEYEQKMKQQTEEFERRLKDQEEKHKEENETKEEEKGGNGCVIH